MCPDVLYQEYRDTSKQQEIEQRRQRDGLPAAGSGVVAAPALQLQLRNSSHSLSLWQNLDVVKDSGQLQALEPKEIIVQEVRHVDEDSTIDFRDFSVAFASESMFPVLFLYMERLRREMATQL